MQTFDVLLELPEPLYVDIGRIIAIHSYLEYALSLIVQDQLRLDPKKARIAIRDPRSSDTFDMIKELAGLDEIKFPEAYVQFGSLLNRCKRNRDSLAHGIWVIEPKTRVILLRQTSGTWQPDKNVKGKVKRKTKPEGAIFSKEHLESIYTDIVSAIDLTLDLRAIINAAMPATREA